MRINSLIKKSFIKRFNRIKILTQFLISFILLCSLSVLFVGSFLISATENFVNESVNEKHLEVAKRASSEIEQFVNNTISLIKNMADLPEVEGLDPFQQSRNFNRLQLQNDFYRKIFSIDSLGYVITTTDLAGDTLNYRDISFFKISFGEGQSYISDADVTQNLPAITVSEPIVRLTKLVGVLAAEVDLSSLWSLVDSIKFKEFGSATIIARDGTLIAHRDRRKVYQKESFPDSTIIAAIANGMRGNTVFYEMNEEGEREEMICGYVPIKALSWGVIVYQPVSDAFALAQQMRFQLIFIMIFSIALASVLSIVISRNLVKPIKSVVDGTIVFSKGDLSHRIDVPKTSELATLANEFNKMADALILYQKKLQRAERLSTTSKFASVVAHEVRNPLNSMVINMQILKRELEKRSGSKQKMLKYLNIVNSEVQRLDDLIRDYLTLSKMPKADLKMENIKELLNDAITSLHEEAATKKVAIERKYNLDDPYLYVDKEQIKQVFLNIIVNAIQSMQEGGKLLVKIENGVQKENEEVSNDRVLIKFKDSGIGIPKESLPEVFDFFYTTKKGGTGLGLAVARQIIMGHKGSIEVDSEPKSGTTVSIILDRTVTPDTM